MGTLRVSEIFNDSRFKLFAVESVDLHHSKENTICMLNGDIKPIAVVVYGPNKIYALDMEAKLIDLDQLRRGIPELDAIITPFNKA